ncbi:MAG TPA: M20/M25/M40 family metallo-hydrolase, partial [Candidatus Dormibacteraeota bacterium]|nr:M20/M25/M40 family metallo-hydrolase [Candidatus Dormibacteraeota bacterium]
MQELDAYCADNEPRFLSELAGALRIPSISADPEFAPRVRSSAEHLAEAARASGLHAARVIDTPGHPAVYAERIVDPSLPTVLVYGHHDVQPVDPLDEWESPPFEPRVQDGYIYARGAQDDKGQVFVHLKAVEAVLHTRGELPVNIKLIVEGEEETSSGHFEALINEHRELLAADVLVVSDTSFVARDIPSLCVGLRGVAAVEVEVSGPAHDLHSGAFGGTVANPAEELARMLAGLRDPVSRRVTVDGFYDDVRELSAQERALFERIPFDEARYREDAGRVPTI